MKSKKNVKWYLMYLNQNMFDFDYKMIGTAIIVMFVFDYICALITKGGVFRCERPPPTY